MLHNTVGFMQNICYSEVQYSIMIVDWSMLPLLGMLGGSIIRRDFFFLSVFGFNGAFCSNLLCFDGLIHSCLIYAVSTNILNRNLSLSTNNKGRFVHMWLDN